MFKGYFNDLVAARMMDLGNTRIKSASKKLRRVAK